jgi:hypothetical protein
VLLIGDVESQGADAAPARDLFTGPVFAARRQFAEASGRPWFILSSRWGLVHPDEVIAPYRLSLAELPPMYRRAWGRLVSEQLANVWPIERGDIVEIYAEEEFLHSLRAPLQYLELTVVETLEPAVVR